MPGMQSAQPVAASADRMNFGPSPENGRRNAEIHPVHTGILFFRAHVRIEVIFSPEGDCPGVPLRARAPPDKVAGVSPPAVAGESAVHHSIVKAILNAVSSPVTPSQGRQ